MGLFEYFGTCIQSTHRLEDLFPAFIVLLQAIEGEHGRSEHKWFEDESAWDDERLLGLMDKLNEYAPQYCYFGAHPGDGSDFGFWLDHFTLEEDIETGELLAVSDLSEIPIDHVGNVLLINDHGNKSLYFIGIDDVLQERWSLV